MFSSDKLRLEKLIGAGNENADFALNEGFNMNALNACSTTTQKAFKGSGSKKTRSTNIGESCERKRSDTERAHDNLPVLKILHWILCWKRHAILRSRRVCCMSDL